MSKFSPLRRKQVRRAILETLQMAGGYALEVQTLQTHIDDLIKPPLTGTEYDDEIRSLWTSEHIRHVKSEIDPLMKQYVITDLGRALLASI